MASFLSHISVTIIFGTNSVTKIKQNKKELEEHIVLLFEGLW